MPTVTPAVASSLDLGGLTDDELAEAWAAADVDDPAVYTAFLAEFDQRSAAERMARARAVQDAIRAEALLEVEAQYRAASKACNGQLVARGKREKVRDDHVLWRMPEDQARRLASPELLEIWDNPATARRTAGEIVKARLAENRAARAEARKATKGDTDERDTALAGPETGPFRPEPAAPQAPESRPGRAVQRGGPAAREHAGDGQDGDGGPGTGPVQPGRVTATGGSGNMRDKCSHPHRVGTSKQCADCPLRAPAGTGAAGGQEPTDEEIYGPGRTGNGNTGAPPAPPAPHGQPGQFPLGVRCPLDTAREFAADILWMPGHALDALTLIAAASHVLDAWQTVPRVLATSDEPQSGKTTLLDVLRLLGNAAWDGTGATSYALRARFNEPEPPFIVIDEISDVFGRSGRAGAGNPIGLIARHGYRRTATVSMSVNRTAEDVPAFAFMAFGGLRTAIPADIRTRAIVFKMQPVPASVRLAAESTDPEVEALAADYRASLHSYVRGVLLPKIRQIQRRFTPPHPAFKDRKDQVFRALYITALAADEAEYERYLQVCETAEANGMDAPPEPALDWGNRALAAFKALMLDASDLPALLPAQKMLRDAAGYVRGLPAGTRFAFAADIKDWLLSACPEPLWASLTERRIEHLMTEALGESQVFTLRGEDGGKRRARGFAVAPVTGAWDALEMSLYPPAPSGVAERRSLFDDLPDEDEDDHSTHANHELVGAM